MPIVKTELHKVLNIGVTGDLFHKLVSAGLYVHDAEINILYNDLSVEIADSILKDDPELKEFLSEVRKSIDKYLREYDDYAVLSIYTMEG